MNLNKKFLFLIPLTPDELLNTERKELWFLCQKSLILQSYQNWKALIIGKSTKIFSDDKRFIQIHAEGTKEEKLQKATEHIISNNILIDYIIRLDDDDIINPTILEKVSKIDYDIFVDKHQCFWHYESGKVSKRVWNWFPNTCIHKREHALTEWGNYAKGSFKRFKKQALLIENDHSQLHPYYKGKKVVFADKNHPIYLRTITSNSITAKNSQDHKKYLTRFGLWQKNDLEDFQFLKHFSLNDNESLPKFSMKEILTNKWLDFRSNINYLKNIANCK